MRAYKKELKKDIATYYSGAIKGDITILDDNGSIYIDIRLFIDKE